MGDGVGGRAVFEAIIYCERTSFPLSFRSECVLGHDERKERQLETHNTLEYELATLDQGNAELHRVLRTEETKSL